MVYAVLKLRARQNCGGLGRWAATAGCAAPIAQSARRWRFAGLVQASGKPLPANELASDSTLLGLLCKGPRKGENSAELGLRERRPSAREGPPPTGRTRLRMYSNRWPSSEKLMLFPARDFICGPVS